VLEAFGLADGEELLALGGLRGLLGEGQGGKQEGGEEDSERAHGTR
jgi:hypothetical protein